MRVSVISESGVTPFSIVSSHNRSISFRGTPISRIWSSVACVLSSPISTLPRLSVVITPISVCLPVSMKSSGFVEDSSICLILGFPPPRSATPSKFVGNFIIVRGFK